MKQRFLALLREPFTTFLEAVHFFFVEEGVSFVTNDFV